MIRTSKGQFTSESTHTRHYPKTPESWISWFIGESENRIIQQTIRSDKKLNDPKCVQVNYNGQIKYRKILPSTCLCHENFFHSIQKRKIYDGLIPKSKSKLSRIFNSLDLIQSTRRRIKDRIYRETHKKEESEYHKKRNLKIRLTVLQAYSKNNEPYCNCCGASHVDILAIDHVGGGGNNHRKKLKNSTHEPSNLYSYLIKLHKKTGNWPDGYQVLCVSCNWISHLHGSCSSDFHMKIRTKK